MPRTRTVTWTYTCDVTTFDGRPACDNVDTVTAGDRSDWSADGLVHNQGDADTVARRHGWSVGSFTFCPAHAGGAA